MAAARWCPAPALTGRAAACLLLWLGLAPSAQARTSCSYTGPPTNLLTITTTGDADGEIGRLGEQIVVGEERPTPCSGGVPTVLNTDTIKVVMRGLITNVALSLDGGLFSPGATPEAEGASEIEVEFSGPDAFGIVVGTRRADVFHWVPGGTHPGLNLNPTSASDQDVDVTVTGGEDAFLAVHGAAGDDRIMPHPGAVFTDGIFSDGGRGDDLLIAPQAGGNLFGETGDDVLTGGRSSDVLDGGPGNDRVEGNGGRDQIDGGPGRDLLSGGRGGDRVEARDSERDTVRCGSGRDRVRADRRDRLRGCELVQRR
jgi:Ca2+-binding RTX toxin-like protein